MSTHRLSSAPVDVPPVFLPHAIINVVDGGTITAMLDGEPVSSGPAPWSRSRFADLLDVLTLQGTRAVRVELHEVDGQVFTDIVQATKRTAVEAAPRTRRERRASSSAPLIEMSGEHFIPGEDVAVAIAMRIVKTSADGHARTVVDVRDLPPGATGVILFGRESGRTVARDLT